MTDQDTAVLLWYLWHGGIAFLILLVATAIAEGLLGEDD